MNQTIIKAPRDIGYGNHLWRVGLEAWLMDLDGVPIPEKKMVVFNVVDSSVWPAIQQAVSLVMRGHGLKGSDSAVFGAVAQDVEWISAVHGDHAL